MKLNQLFLTCAFFIPAELAASTFAWGDDVIYKDDFLFSGARNAGNALAGPPETNASTNNVSYLGHSVGQFTISMGPNGDFPRGCLSYTSNTGDDAVALLPLPMGTKKFEVDLDIKPFKLLSPKSSVFAGIVLVNAPDNNFFGPNPSGQVRIGFNPDPSTGAYRLLFHMQPDTSFPADIESVPVSALSNFNPNGWNTLKVIADYGTGTVSVSVNNVHVKDWVIHASPPYVGIEALADANSTGNTAYFNGFVVQSRD
jgi:hypothetical protein